MIILAPQSIFGDTYRIPVCAMDAEREVLEDPAKNLTGMSGKSLSLKAEPLF